MYTKIVGGTENSTVKEELFKMLQPISLTTIFSHWSTLINYIIFNYFSDGMVVCILQNKHFELDIEIDADNATKNLQFINIWRETLNETFKNDVYDMQKKWEFFENRNLTIDELIVKLNIAIEKNHCEGFISFQEDIPIFSSAFRNASTYASWSSERNIFLFAYSQDLIVTNEAAYFDDLLFLRQPRLLIIKADSINSTKFELKTNKFVGSLQDKPDEIISINHYDAEQQSFKFPEQVLYPNKLRNLQGRELIIGGFNYPPFVGLDGNKEPQVKDMNPNNPNGTIYITGTEVVILQMYCYLYNCSIQVDSSEKGEWGEVYENGTGIGLIGMAMINQADMVLGAIYAWSLNYVDVTGFLGRSGITCVVPKPQRLTSWVLPLKPFQGPLWAGVFLCLLIESLALLVTYHVELLLVLEKPDKNYRESTYYGFMTTLKIFLSQGPDFDVVSFSVRTILFSSFMIDIIITSVYGGGLASILTLPTLGEAADSRERFKKFGIPWTATSDDWTIAVRSEEDLVRAFQIHDWDETRELAKTENMGFVVERLAFGHFGNTGYLTSEALDRLKLMIDDIYFQFTVGAVPRIWPFLATYNSMLYNWHSSGLSQYWEWKASSETLDVNLQGRIQSSMYESTDTGPVKLDMSNFAGLIIIWIVGIFLSILSFGLEIVYSKYVEKKARIIIVTPSPS